MQFCLLWLTNHDQSWPIFNLGAVTVLKTVVTYWISQNQEQIQKSQVSEMLFLSPSMAMVTILFIFPVTE